MVRAAVLALVLWSGVANADDDRFPDSPWLNWVAQNSPYGFDVTPDGTIWINLAETGQREDYAIRAQDLQTSRQEHNRKPVFWLRGYYKNNPEVPYRESKGRFTMDCDGETISRSQVTFFKANGDVHSTYGWQPASYIVPGTYAAELQRLFCVVRD